MNVPASLRAAAMLLGCGLGIATSAVAATGCIPLAPGANFSAYLTDMGNGLVQAQDICYANGTSWWEDNTHGPGNVKLFQRFDYYRPAQVPLTQPVPLVIWAHPSGQTEKLNSTRMSSLVAPAARAGFAFMSIEFRHPVGSQLAPTNPPTLPNYDIPNTDVARAVQWARSRAQQLGLDASNVFLIGQSRGTLGILTALMPDQADIGSGTDYLRYSSRVNAAVGVQAQSSYNHDEVRNTFIVSSDWPRFDDPLTGYPMYTHAGSAISQVSDDDPPIQLRYDRVPTDPNRVVPLHMANADGTCPNDPNVPGGCFDEHHPNFGLALGQAYAAHPALAGKFSVQYGLDPLHYFDNYICFFISHLSAGGRVETEQAGGQVPAACGVR